MADVDGAETDAGRCMLREFPTEGFSCHGSFVPTGTGKAGAEKKAPYEVISRCNTRDFGFTSV